MSNYIRTIEQKVIEIIANTLDSEQKKINSESKLKEDLGMDSIKAIEAIFEIESIFKIHILDDDVRNMKRVGDIVDYISKHLE